MTPTEQRIYEYQDGLAHGTAMRRTGRRFNRQTVADNLDDPFWRGYRDGWQSTDRRMCPECGAESVTRSPGLLPVCSDCDWTGWDKEPTP